MSEINNSWNAIRSILKNVFTFYEIKEIVDKYDTKITKFPKMLSTDPIARYYGVRPGGMFKIIRQSASSGEYISYRSVR